MNDNNRIDEQKDSMQKEPVSYKNATGPIAYGMTNDYVFRTVLQKNQKVLQGLICAVLHLRPEEVHSVMITNPIETGKTADMKGFILDIHVILNDHTKLNLEMQVKNLRNWRERSLSYLCRSFDQLAKGQEYGMADTVIHIGFLNFSPGWNIPEFYAKYQLLNIKNHTVYSDKFVLGVVDLTHIELATSEDQEWLLDHWAKLFKANTWEEIQMIAKGSEYLSSASQTLYELNADDIERQKCRAREDYYRLQNSMVRELEKITAEKAELTAEKDELTAEKEELLLEIERLRQQLGQNVTTSGTDSSESAD